MAQDVVEEHKHRLSGDHELGELAVDGGRGAAVVRVEVVDRDLLVVRLEYELFEVRKPEYRVEGHVDLGVDVQGAEGIREVGGIDEFRGHVPVAHRIAGMDV